MTKRDWLSVALKTSGVVLAIYYFCNFVVVVGIFLAEVIKKGLSDPEHVLQFLLYSVGTGCAFIIALVLVKRGDRLAARLVGGSGETLGDANLAWQRNLFHVSLKVIGVICLTRGVARLLMNIGSIFPLSRFYEGVGWFRLSVHQVSWPVLLLAVGAWLFFDGKWLVRLAFGPLPSEPTEGESGLWKPQTVFALALRVFGVVLLTIKLPWLISVLIIRVLPFAAEASKNVFGAGADFNWGNFLGGLLVLAIGVYFVMGSRHLVTFVFRKKTTAAAD